jgi:queuosine precursor transporter
MRRFRYLDLLTIGFVVVLLVSNLVGQKICQIGPLKVSGAQLLFPIAYICGDVFTEVYGYAASRRAIWIGFFAMALLSVMGAIAVALPAAPGWPNQQAFATVFGLVPRFAIASLIAYWAGEFTNSFTLAKMKILTRGRWLWTRTMGIMILSSYLTKVVYETLATPLTYLVVAQLKRAESVDAYDTTTNFNPFAVAQLTAQEKLSS